MGKNKFTTDVLWNLISTGVLAVSGMLFSFLIVFFYNPSVLGLFNKTYAFFIIISQITVMGIHSAVLKYTSENANDLKKQNTILKTALGVVPIISSVITGAVIIFICLFSRDNASKISMILAALALPLFSINKVILWYFNGKSFMKLYAVFQTLRPIFIVVAIILISVLKLPYVILSSCFLFSEIVVFVFGFYKILKEKALKSKFSLSIAKELFKFGFNILPGNMVLEINTKVDIICLSFILQNDYLVGIYSFAAIFAEGFYQLFIVFRRIINPKISFEYANNKNFNDFYKGIEKNTKKYLSVLSVLGAVCVSVGYYFFCILFDKSEYLIATVPLVMLLLSIALNSRFIILGNFLSQIGAPKKESLVNIVSMLTNIVLNLLLIPFYGMLGAAVATAVSYFVFSFGLWYNSKKYI